MRTGSTVTKDKQIFNDQVPLAVGTLLGFYRRRKKGMSQKKLAKVASLSPSTLAMFEAGLRIPPKPALQRISSALGLDAYMEHQLQVLATYPNPSTAPGNEWFMPDDVLQGAPIFMRSLVKESEFQSKASISEMWIVTDRPMALDGEMREMLRNRLLHGRTKFVYFLDRAAGREPFDALWDQLCSESGALKKTIVQKLRCVLVPPSFCLSHFGICNPGQYQKMFGRLVVHSSGTPVGFLPMDEQQVNRAYHLLASPYQSCLARKEQQVDTKNGRFSLIEPHWRSSDQKTKPKRLQPEGKLVKH